METLLLTAEDVEANAPLSEVIPAIESAFAADARGDATMPAKSYVDLPQYDGDFRSMPAYVDTGDWDAAGVKWVNVHPQNRERFDLPTVIGTLIYSDPETAVPLAIMDATRLTGLRTGGAAAVATDYLADPEATTLGLVGAGVQSHTQLEAISLVREIEEVVISDRNADAIEAFVDAFEDQYTVRTGTVTEAGHCDILSTVTPVESPIVSLEDVGANTHINAIGADAAGKHELADELLLESTLLVDDHTQATHSGECNVPYSQGGLTDADIDAELGEIVAEGVNRRGDETGRTVFDSTGLAIQDMSAAHIVYETALESDAGTTVELFRS